MHFRVEMLGELRLVAHGEVVTRFRSHKAACLLAFLAMHPNKPHLREELADMLWPEPDKTPALASLSTELASIKKLMEPTGVRAGKAVITDRTTIRLNGDACRTDVADFTRLAARYVGRMPDRDAIAQLLEAAALYRGDLLPGHYDDWVLIERQELKGQYAGLVRHLVRLFAEGGEVSAAIDWAYRGVDADPLDEHPWVDLLALLAVNGRAGEARKQFRVMENLWRHNLGAVPPDSVRQIIAADETRLSPGATAVVTRAVDRQPYLSGSPVILSIASIRPQSTKLDAMLHGSVTRHGGTPAAVKETSPSIAAFFESSRSVLACLRECERLARAHSARFSAALHMGEAVDGSVDLIVERGLRLLRAAHEDQVLCTDITAGLIPTSTASPASCHPLGRYRLLGAEAAEQVYEVWFGPPQSYVRRLPLAAEDHAQALPSWFTRFFGRSEEIDTIYAELLGAPRMDAIRQATGKLITLLGPGGMGKSRLALEVARDARAHHRFLPWWVSLTDVARANEIPIAIARSLSLPNVEPVRAIEAVADALSGQPALIILDNIDAALASSYEGDLRHIALFQTLRRKLPDVVWLVTSQRRLGLPGERVIAVGPLETRATVNSSRPRKLEEYATIPGIQMFVDRASIARPGFALSMENADAVHDLCVKLEGIPLAIALAAANANALTPVEILAQLGNRFDLLQEGSRPPRHRRLVEVLEWSYSHLDQAEKRVFAALSVFRGGWTAEAAVEVCNEKSTPQVLVKLANSSFITMSEGADGRLRYDMLETLREFGALQLGVETGDVRRRHAMYYRGLGDVGDQEQANIAAALR